MKHALPIHKETCTTQSHIHSSTEASITNPQRNLHFPITHTWFNEACITNPQRNLHYPITHTWFNEACIAHPQRNLHYPTTHTWFNEACIAHPQRNLHYPITHIWFINNLHVNYLTAHARLNRSLHSPITHTWSNRNLYHIFISPQLTLKVLITTKFVCFCRRLKCLRSLTNKQCRLRSDCSYRSSLIWVHAVCLYTKHC